jgi:hypothetical protein
MQLSSVEKRGYVAAVGILVLVLVFGWKFGRLGGETISNTRVGLGTRVKIQQRFSEERNFIRYTANRGRLTFPSAQGTTELCRRFGISQAALLNANGQRNSPVLQLDSLGQIRIPL